MFKLFGAPQTLVISTGGEAEVERPPHCAVVVAVVCSHSTPPKPRVISTGAEADMPPRPYRIVAIAALNRTSKSLAAPGSFARAVSIAFCATGRAYPRFTIADSASSPAGP